MSLRGTDMNTSEAYEAGVKLALYDAGLLKLAQPMGLTQGIVPGAAVGGLGTAALAARMLGSKAALPAALIGALGGGILGRKLHE